jgi:protein TonB
VSQKKQLRRWLWWGFALSVLLHMIGGPFLGHIHYNEPEKTEPIVVSVSTRPPLKITTPTPKPTPKPTPHPTPAPTPKPTPPPTPAPKPTQPPHKNPPPAHLKIHVPKTTSVSAHSSAEKAYVPVRGTENGVPAGHGAAPGLSDQQGTSGPPGTPAPACAQPHLDAATKNAVQPEYPEIAREQGASGIATVNVSLDAHGNVTAVSIAKSTGNAVLDQEALKAAKMSTFTPEVVDCKPIGGTYFFKADFESQ